ncbi:MAG: hypothetical protein ABJA20_00285 [Novosphingobium sp.]
MDDTEDLRARLNSIELRIEKTRDQLKLKGLFHKDREATADELRQRYDLLAKQLDNEVGELEAHGVHINSLEKSVLGWVNSLNLDN